MRGLDTYRVDVDVGVARADIVAVGIAPITGSTAWTTLDLESTVKPTVKPTATESAESVMPVVLILVDVNILIHPSATNAVSTETPVEATDETGEERNDPKAAKALTATSTATTLIAAAAAATEDTAEEVLVQILVVVDVLVDVLIVVVGERLVFAEPKAPLCETALVLEETGVLERDVVIDVKVSVLVDPEPETVQAVGGGAGCPIATAPAVTALSEEAIEPAEVGHQVLVGVDILVDVLVVVIVERASTSTTAIAAIAAIAPLRRTLRLFETAETATAKTATAGAGLLRIFFVYIPVIIDILVNVVAEIIAVGFEFPVDDVRQTSKSITSLERTPLRPLNDRVALACRLAFKDAQPPGIETREHEAVPARGIRDPLHIGEIGEIVCTAAVGNQLSDGLVDGLDADNLLL